MNTENGIADATVMNTETISTISIEEKHPDGTIKKFILTDEGWTLTEITKTLEDGTVQKLSVSDEEAKSKKTLKLFGSPTLIEPYGDGIALIRFAGLAGTKNMSSDVKEERFSRIENLSDSDHGKTVTAELECTYDEERKKHTFKQELSMTKESAGGHYLKKGEIRSKYIIETDEIEARLGSNEDVDKVFTAILLEANENGFFQKDHNGGILTFPLKDFVSLGAYSRPADAKEAFLKSMHILRSYQIRGYYIDEYHKDAPRVESMINGFDYKAGDCSFPDMFPDYGLKFREECVYVEFNKAINWQFVAPRFIYCPKYLLALNKLARAVLRVIFKKARDGRKKLTEKGHVDISTEQLQKNLVLPNLKGCERPSQLIRDPIKKAVDEIRMEEEKIGKGDLRLEWRVNRGSFYEETETDSTYNYENLDDNAHLIEKPMSVAEWLSNAYLRAYISGDYAEPIIKLQGKIDKKIADNTKKAEKRRQAKAKNEAAASKT